LSGCRWSCLRWQTRRCLPSLSHFRIEEFWFAEQRRKDVHSIRTVKNDGVTPVWSVEESLILLPVDGPSVDEKTSEGNQITGEAVRDERVWEMDRHIVAAHSFCKESEIPLLTYRTIEAVGRLYFDVLWPPRLEKEIATFPLKIELGVHPLSRFTGSFRFTCLLPSSRRRVTEGDCENLSG
jgi:hypothetical protein